jgi:hypothetical protein
MKIFGWDHRPYHSHNYALLFFASIIGNSEWDLVVLRAEVITADDFLLLMAGCKLMGLRKLWSERNDK